MGPVTQERHRPGALKQQNKSHKHGRHRSKGALDKINKGKVAAKNLSKRVKRELRRDERRNQAAQIRHNKREEVVAQKRLVGSAGTAPILIAIIALSKDADPYLALERLKDSDSDAAVTVSQEGYLHLSVPRLKQRFSLIVPQPGQLYAALDALKVADSVLFLLSAAGEGLDLEGETLLSAAFAQGLPTPIVAATDIADLPIKKRSDVKQSLQKILNRWLPDEKLASLDTDMDSQVVLRRLGSQKRRIVAQTDNRAHLMADALQYEPGTEAGFGTLKITGYVRGQPLSVNGLVHIPGYGDYQLLQIDAPEDPHPMLTGAAKRLAGESSMEEGLRLLERANPAMQESLQSENIPDPMDAEQTWPTADELAEADEARKNKIIKRVPKGTSEYQAAWIPDSDAEEGEGSSDEDEEDEEMEAISEEDSQAGGDSDMDDMESVAMSEAPESSKYDKDIDFEEERKALATMKDAHLDQMFPDEVDTPQDLPARIRFQKYRGLKSFRTSPWDPKEELPLDYARIFKFQNFASTRKKILKNDDRPGALPGWYITLHIVRVPESVMTTRATGHPLVVFGLLPHEQKMSVINVVLKRHNIEPQAPIKSKQTLIFHLGFRRFKVNPIFSQHTNGNKHKYERFFQPGSTVVATFFAPIIFPPSSALVFMEHNDGTQHMVATGNVLSINPDRIIVKRTVLSGHPFKVNRKSATVRFMFFNRDDINWFKPLELRTKHGRRGHIKEPLGTHGHMKCVFDGQMKSQDTVLLHLFKRVFPKWTYDGKVPDHEGASVIVSELDD